MENPFQPPLEAGKCSLGCWWPTARGILGAHLAFIGVAAGLAHLGAQVVQLSSAAELLATSFVPTAATALIVGPALMVYVLYQSTASLTERCTVMLLEFVVVSIHGIAIFSLTQS